jgi:hypothetical protein
MSAAPKATVQRLGLYRDGKDASCQRPVLRAGCSLHHVASRT